jgi:hypothetical protein
MTPRALRMQRPQRRPRARRAGHRSAAPDATIEPDPGPPPEAVFDRLTGPYGRRAALAMPGSCEHDEET